MSKKHINSILSNILWCFLSLYPLILWFIFLLKGGQYALDTYITASDFYYPTYFGEIFIGRLNNSSYIVSLVSSFLNLFNCDYLELRFLFSYVIYIQFLRIIINLVFFLFRKSHEYLEIYTSDSDNDIL